MHFKRHIVVLAVVFPQLLLWAQMEGVQNVSKFGYVINTSSEESAPKLRKEGKELEMYFVRTFDVNNTGGEMDQDIWVSTKDETGVWSLAKNLDNVNNLNHNAVGSLFKNDMYVLFSNKRNKHSSIGVSKRDSKEPDAQSKWSKPRPILGEVTIPKGAVDFCISSDDKFLIISKMSENAFSQQDLFIYDLEKQKLLPLSDNINSLGSEISPFLSSNNDTLYFASNGLKGYGNYDIFYSIRGDTFMDWGEPVNLGPEVNTSGFDAYFSTIDNLAVWSSNRDGDNADLYYAEIQISKPMRLTISKKDVGSFQGRDGQAKVTITGGRPPYSVAWNTGARSTNIEQLEKGKYSVSVTDNQGNVLTETVEIMMPSPKNKDVLSLPEIQYELGTWTFLKTDQVNSIDSLNQIAKLLKEYPKLQIELWSHTDCRGVTEENLLLSQQRANAVFTYLVTKQNIEAQRIIPVGKGEDFPRFIYNPETKTRVQLTEKYILDSFHENKEKQEILHQLNRRTEAKIIDDNFEYDPTFKVDESFFIKIE